MSGQLRDRRLPLLVCSCVLTLLGTVSARSQTRGLTAVTTADGQKVELYEESHALVIGMINYRAGWRPLPGVETDLVAVGNVLRTHGFTVRVERDLARDAFDRVLREFIAAYGVRPRNRLIIYFAGHGHTQQASDGRQLGFIVPVDAPLPTADAVGFKSKAISMDQIEVYAREIESRHALMVFDSCFSGSLFTVTRAGPPGPLVEKIAKPVRQFITSGTDGQEVPDRSEFRRQFVSALEGEADLTKDGYVTATELGVFLEDKVAWYTKGAQTPKSGKLRDAQLDQGDMVFVSPRGSTAGSTTTTSRPTTVTDGSRGLGDDRTYWESIKDRRDTKTFDDFQKRFPTSAYRSLAERRVEELDREDATATASRLLGALDARNANAAYALSADRVRQMVPESSFAAMMQEALKTPLLTGRHVVYEERSPDGMLAVVLFIAGDQYQRVTLMREGTRWGAWNYRWLEKSIAVPSQGPAFRDAALAFLDRLNAKRSAAAHALLASMQRGQLNADQFAQLNANYMQLGSPSERTLVYLEQDSALSAFVVFKTRFASSSVFERISLMTADGTWLVTAFWFTPTTAR